MNIGVKLRPETERRNVLRDFVFYPLTYLRIAATLCSIIVFGCVADKLKQNPVSRTCAYNENNNCCDYAMIVGVIGFLLCLVFLVKDVLYNVLDFSTNLNLKKLFLIVDSAVNGLWAFLWFVAFIFTADQWRKTSSTSPVLKSLLPRSVINCANSGVAFSFLCTILWTAIVAVNVILLIRLIRQGPDGGYSSFPQSSPATSDDREAAPSGQPSEY